MLLNKPKIDSFRLLIPTTELEYLCPTFRSEFVPICFETGIVEYDKKHIKLSEYNNVNGIKTRFSIETRFDSNKNLTEYFVIGISAKMLKEQYFYGINKDTIQRCFNFINETNIVKMSKEAFLSAKVVDTDICVDFLLQSTTCKEVVKIAYELTLPSKSTTCTAFSDKKNTGIQWGKREWVGKSYLKKQFLKYYAKIVELENNSKDFYDCYIKDVLNNGLIFANEVNANNLLRVETTIKNKDHWETYGVKIETLNDLLNLELEAFFDLFNRPISVYMTGYKAVYHKPELTLQERMYLFSIQQYAENKKINPNIAIPFIVDEIFRHQPKTQNTRNQKSILKRRLFELYQIDKKTMSENKNNNQQLVMSELIETGLIPNS